MINKICRMQSLGVFRDFTWPNDLQEFSKYNLIYGWNGTGKTTLSRLFQNLEKRTRPDMGSASFQINGREVHGAMFPRTTENIRVFNRNFIDNSVFPVERKGLEPIFVLGEEGIEKQIKVEKLKIKLENLQHSKKNADESSHRCESELNAHRSNKAKFIKDSLRIQGTGKYNNYNKNHYDNRSSQIEKSGMPSQYICDDVARSHLFQQFSQDSKNPIGLIPIPKFDFSSVKARVQTLLQTTVTSNTIKELKNNPELNIWVSTGFKLHKGGNVKKCAFCTQPIPSSRIEELNQHFNDSYNALIEDIDKCLHQVNNISAAATALKHKIPDPSNLFKNLSEPYAKTKAQATSVLDAITDNCKDLVSLLEQKKTRPFTSFPFQESCLHFSLSAVPDLNNLITQHNDYCEFFQKHKMEAADKLADSMIAEALPEHIKLKAAKEKSKIALEQLEREIQPLEQEIGQLESEIRGFRRPAEQLNNDLSRYLGHSEFYLEPKETGYTVMREGRPADRMSDGERSALALLYFLKSLEADSFDLKKGIVVLDDPVSSLDANSLFRAFGFIRDRVSDAKQVFILTHSYLFFKQTKSWMRRQRKEHRFYMIAQYSESNVRFSTLCRLDPLLELYNSEYHYLFKVCFNSINGNLSRELGHSIGLPNLARRLLEGFLSFRFPDKTSLWKALEAVNFDKEKIAGIYSFVNEYSHGYMAHDGVPEWSSLCEAPHIMRDIMDLIKSQDAEHFGAMVALAKEDS